MAFNAWSLAAPLLNLVSGAINESKGRRVDWGKLIASSALSIAKHGPMKADANPDTSKKTPSGVPDQPGQPDVKPPPPVPKPAAPQPSQAAKLGIGQTKAAAPNAAQAFQGLGQNPMAQRQLGQLDDEWRKRLMIQNYFT